MKMMGEDKEREGAEEKEGEMMTQVRRAQWVGPTIKMDGRICEKRV